MNPRSFDWELASDDAILVVEDNDGDARLVELMLIEAFGPAVTLSRSSTRAGALAHLAEAEATCVVLDLGLPDADGVETVRRVASYAPGAAIIVLTGDDDANTGIEAVQAGAQDYLVKGRSSAETLGRAVRYALVRKRAEQTLAQAQRIAHLGSWELEAAGTAMTWSEELYRLLGFDADQIPDTDAMMSRVHPDDRALLIAAIRGATTELMPFALDHRVLVPDGTVRWVRSQGFGKTTGTRRQTTIQGTMQDITEQRLAEEALAHQALHDPLTGLPNRALFVDRLAQALARLHREPSTLGVIFLDIDRFKVINDSLGHAAGDRMLQAMAKRLSGLLRAGDTVARLGGDEFVILCDRLTGELEAVGIADRLHTAMAEPLQSNEGELVLTVSAGIAFTTSALTSPEALLRDADAAMYGAKAGGRARAEVFAQSMRSTAIHRLDTEVALRRSITMGDFRIHYQPILDLPNGRIIGTEALVRWQHPVRGLLGPDQFIPVAEETGLIVPLGGWVLAEACRQAKRFQERNEAWSSLTMAVNLSGCQVNEPGVVELVRAALTNSGLHPALLQLEITESVLMKDAAAAVNILGLLKMIGVRLSIDDFGTGYSSLAYLKRFPIDVLKIDRSFVDGLGHDPEDSAIVAAVISLAGAMQLDVIAEGVETDLQRSALVDLGCGKAQGYLFARPMPAFELETLLDQELARSGSSTSTPA
jgi:diguanylate cyclase (GGDEF)-like protein/PAS domain S-box-containing protein